MLPPDGGQGSRPAAVREGRIITCWVVDELLGRGFTVALALTAALSLLGLLGTVIGMVDTFGRLGGGGSAASTAGAGIGLAPTATQ